MGMRNPYDVFDDPLTFDRYEHIGEVHSGMAIPWGSETPCVWNREWESGSTMRERLASMAS